MTRPSFSSLTARSMPRVLLGVMPLCDVAVAGRVGGGRLAGGWVAAGAGGFGVVPATARSRRKSTTLRRASSLAVAADMSRACHGFVMVNSLGQPALQASNEPRFQPSISSAAVSPSAFDVMACTIWPP
jgi:hypothetical protein